MVKISYGKQDISQEDINAVIEVLKSDWLTQGPLVKSFENAVKNYCKSKYAVAVSNGTAALHLACLVCDLTKDDYVWTSPNTFVASANCALYAGAKIDFVDIDIKTYNMCVINLEAKLKKAAKEGVLPSVVIPVHFAGQSCDMKRIKELSEEYNFVVVEDASHAIGGSYLNQPIGCCEYSDMAIFSFHPVKIITSGEGGMIVTNKQNFYDKLSRLKTHGITRDPDQFVFKNSDPWYYEQIDLGFNYRITDIQCALGLSQLTRLDEFVKRRNYLACRYDDHLKKLPITVPYQISDSYSSLHLYVIRLHLNELQKTHREIFIELREAGIGVNLHYIPVHTQPYYRNLGFKWGDYPVSEQYYKEAITIPLYYSLSNEEQDFVISTLKAVIN